jgi:putative FmdB family regulatory protein
LPTYQYRCTQCGNELEAVQKFSDPALTECPVCAGALRKIYSAVGVVFKGSGFYRTDSRAAAKDGADKSVDAQGRSKEEAGKSANGAGADTNGAGTDTKGADKTKIGADAANGSSSHQGRKSTDSKPAGQKTSRGADGKVGAGSGSSSTGG